MHNNSIRFIVVWSLFIALAGAFFLITNSDQEQKNYGENLLKTPLVKSSSESSGSLKAENVIEETNKQRSAFGMERLSESEKLNEIAEAKVDDMFEKQYFEHISPEGVGVSDIAEQEGYKYLLVGDNLAVGPYKDDEDLVTAWMNSQGHKENILDEKYQEIGVAVRKDEFEGRETWMAVQVFGTPFSVCPLTDESLEAEIEEKQSTALEIKSEIDRLEKEIEDEDYSSRGEHNEKVERVKNLIGEYNSLVNELGVLISEHNQLVKQRRDCLEEKGL